MYVQIKQGFVEVDRWDGTRVPHTECNAAIAEALDHGARSPGALARIAPTILVVRARARHTLEALAGYVRREVRVIESPPGWDYEHRMFVTAEEWATIMCAVVEEIDYRNFKHWHGSDAADDAGVTDEQHRLAREIWRACRESYRQDRKLLDRELAEWDSGGAA